MSDTSKIILTPGPVPIPPEIKALLPDQSVHHRSNEFKNILLQTFTKLPGYFGSKNPVILQPVTGSGAMESSLVNTLSPKDKVLVVNSGKFGNRWVEIANSLDLNITEIKIPWGESFKIENVLENLKDNKAILTQACETSTGALHPIRELTSHTKNKDTLLIVDAISSLGAVEFEMDWGIDVAIASSHKTFMSPPGISAICLSDKAWDFYKKSKFKKYYLDLKADLEFNKVGQTRFTSYVSIIRGINWVLNNIDKQERFKRVNDISKAMKLIEDMGFKIFPRNPSSTLTVATLPDLLNQKLSAEDLKTKLERKNILIAGGQGPLKNKVIRIGHNGYIQNKDILLLFSALADIIDYDKTEELLNRAEKILE